MLWTAWNAVLSKPDESGVPARAHLEIAAAAKNPRAIAELTPPGEFPDELSYLAEWSSELHGRSGVGMSGLAPLSFGTLADWMRLTDTHVEPYEVDALMQLDDVRMNPSAYMDRWKQSQAAD